MSIVTGFANRPTMQFWQVGNPRCRAGWAVSRNFSAPAGDGRGPAPTSRRRDRATPSCASAAPCWVTSGTCGRVRVVGASSRGPTMRFTRYGQAAPLTNSGRGAALRVTRGVRPVNGDGRIRVMWDCNGHRTRRADDCPHVTTRVRRRSETWRSPTDKTGAIVAYWCCTSQGRGGDDEVHTQVGAGSSTTSGQLRVSAGGDLPMTDPDCLDYEARPSRYSASRWGATWGPENNPVRRSVPRLFRGRRLRACPVGGGPVRGEAEEGDYLRGGVGATTWAPARFLVKGRGGTPRQGRRWGSDWTSTSSVVVL